MGLSQSITVDDQYIRRSAESLVRCHGDRAVAIGAETAEKWHKRGDAEAAQLWTSISNAARELMAARPKGLAT